MDGPGIQGVSLEPIESHLDRGRNNYPAEQKRGETPNRRANNPRELTRVDSPGKRANIYQHNLPVIDNSVRRVND